ncbi:hypothetical protein [Burkholderia sp. SCN-KJ]|uniref:hypothetical protein n=1 Tax=Burkholderia sp. SCN-KJ TaxID=2969248 RepID=UPI00214F7A50|nr:hypothetical protein [Burkholderia sp. SCN-KJ]MCR4470015.1 hypothetical protein [Burkholderia sp. SCN-KJ]
MKAHIRSAAAGTVMATGRTMILEYQRPVASISNVFPMDGERAIPATGSAGSRCANGRAAGDGDRPETFIEPRMRRLVELALGNSFNLRLAVLNVKAERERFRTTRARSERPAVNSAMM